MLIKRENKNQNKQCGTVNPVYEYLIFQESSRKLVSHTMWTLNKSLFHIATTFDTSKKVTRTSDGQNSVQLNMWVIQIYNSRLNYVKRKHFLLKTVPSDGFGVVLPMPGRVVTGISGRVPLIDEKSTLKSPSFPSLAASISIFSICFSVTMVLKLRVRSTITLPQL